MPIRLWSKLRHTCGVDLTQIPLYCFWLCSHTESTQWGKVMQVCTNRCKWRQIHIQTSSNILLLVKFLLWTLKTHQLDSPDSSDGSEMKTLPTLSEGSCSFYTELQRSERNQRTSWKYFCNLTPAISSTSLPIGWLFVGFQHECIRAEHLPSLGYEHAIKTMFFSSSLTASGGVRYTAAGSNAANADAALTTIHTF